MLQFNIVDILSVGFIVIGAALFIIYTIFRMHKDKCATMCNGCSKNSCSVKDFSTAAPIKIIKLHKTLPQIKSFSHYSK
ncbi:MAG: FeoB-associated Cys-rich membrane protein [Burkholderiales bacterium]|nr:FeoB-associated Cys-rich membrane protein [Burkholderiales bacterium]